MSRVQSIERAFAVLGAVSGGPIGVTDVADRVRLPKSTVARLLASLAREGAVEQVPGDSRYRLGPRVSTLAAASSPERLLVAAARPELEALAAALGEAAGLSVRDGRSVRYIDQVSVDHEVQVRDWTGTRAPLHAVSSGLVFLAHMPESDVDAYVGGGLDALTPRTETDPEALRRRLAEVRSAGFAWVHDEFAEGISSVAAPVSVGHDIVATVHVHGPSYRFPRPDLEHGVGGQVAATAARISSMRTAGVPPIELLKTPGPTPSGGASLVATLLDERRSGR
ncbi:MAG TPA: IclR family transcriptional regulator [Candidatus Limnocylindrales bacterium]|nr:IclR family transcriptional regulator [Candidatus Limnocylindrales bacterium]